IRPVFSSEELYTGVGTNITSNDFAIYPNPAVDHIRLNYPDELGPSTRVDILDAAGRLVKSVSGRQDHISLTDLNTGLYVVRATDIVHGAVQVSRLIVKP
ncbi:MAG: T9SS type A sorting domain-containing protein, partial [Bacteroidota bacterium]